jgi:hypothetical protein
MQTNIFQFRNITMLQKLQRETLWGMPSIQTLKEIKSNIITLPFLISNKIQKAFFCNEIAYTLLKHSLHTA